MSPSDAPSSTDWRDDPGWRAVAYDPTLCDWADIPNRPLDHAELSTSPAWASLYEGNRIVVTWHRPVPVSEPRATVVANDG